MATSIEQFTLLLVLTFHLQFIFTPQLIKSHCDGCKTRIRLGKTSVWPLDSLHVVGGVEAHAPVLPPFAPALLVLILQLLKLVSCNILTLLSCNIPKVPKVFYP